jgi:hypothetical protein
MSHQHGTLYKSKWKRLDEAEQLVMASTGAGVDEARWALCRAIADRDISIRCRLAEQVNRGVTSREVVDGEIFEIPHDLSPERLDWTRSRPVKCWIITRGAHSLPGYWKLAWIELSGIDLGRLFPTKLARTTDLPLTLRPRGRRPIILEATVAAMRQAIHQGRLTPEVLDSTKETVLAVEYGVSRDTARKARNLVLSEWRSRQMPTDDN